MRNYSIVFLLLLLALQPCSFAQQTQNNFPKVYTFVPEMVYPLGGRPRQVNGDFILKIKADTLVCYLPYFGEATAIDYGSRKSSTDFSSLKFSYTEEKGNKGSMRTKIIPEDNKEVRSIALNWYADSVYADVIIIFNQRQTIRYRGRLRVSDGNH